MTRAFTRGARPALVTLLACGLCALPPAWAQVEPEPPAEGTGDPELDAEPDADTEPAAPSEPDLETLVVPPPVAPAPRNPTQDIRRLLRPEASILEARNRLDQDLLSRGKALSDQRRLESRMAEDLRGTTQRFQEVTALLELERALVRTRLAALARSERTPALVDLLPVVATAETHGFGAFERRRNARAVLGLADRRRIALYTEHLETWRRLQADLQRRTQNLARTRQAITYLEQELTWDREERGALELAVVNEPEFYAAYAHEIEELDQTIASKIKDLAAAAPSDRKRLYFEETRGGLSWPIRNSDVVGGFGVRSYKGARTTWRGAHFVPLRPPREGPTEVRSIYWGYVAWTGWLQGLGQVVILDHTMGYFTLYAHLASIGVEVGQKVASGEVLGLMGDTESYFGPRLYLELRKDGVAVDPVPWLK